MKISVFNPIGLEPVQVYDIDGAKSSISIGRNERNDVVLNSMFVADRAAVFRWVESEWQIEAIALDGVRIGDRALRGGEIAALDRGKTVTIYPFSLTLAVTADQRLDEKTILTEMDKRMVTVVKHIHQHLVERVDILGEDDDRIYDDEYLSQLEQVLIELAHDVLTERHMPLVDHMAGHLVRGELLSKIGDGDEPATISDVWNKSRPWSRMASAIPALDVEFDHLVRLVSSRLSLDRFDRATERQDEASKKANEVEARFWREWNEISQKQHDELKTYLALRYLTKEIKDTLFGYGPLEDLLASPLISEIMVIDSEHIYVERGGVIESSGRRFVSDETTEVIIERIVSRVGRRIDRAQPLVDARLTDGSRVNAIIPPLALRGPCLTIRKFPARKLLIDNLVEFGTLTRVVMEFLHASVEHRCNILVSGGTGTGKTTLLNCLSDFIPPDERIVTIEDTAELQLKKEHVVSLETRQKNVEGAGAYTIRDLVRNALRMRPDRIVVGECRGAEALDMLQAMNTGHDGSLTTIHANSAEDVLLRLEVLVQMAEDLPSASIQRQIASAVDLIVHISRTEDGARKITQVTEVVGIDPYTGTIVLKDLYRLSSKTGTLAATGRLPTYMSQLIEKELLDLDAFYVEREKTR